MVLNPLAIFPSLKQATDVPSNLLLLPTADRCREYCGVTSVVPLTVERFFDFKHCPKKFASSPEELEKVEKVIGRLRFSSVTAIHVQEHYLQACEKGTLHHLARVSVAEDTSHAWLHESEAGEERKPETMESWMKVWSNKSTNKCDIESAVFGDTSKYCEIHQQFALGSARARARKTKECPVCFEPFSSSRRKLFPSCGHAICCACRNKLRVPTCPTCRGVSRVWFSNRYTLYSLLTMVARRHPHRDVLYFDPRINRSRLERLRRSMQIGVRVNRPRHCSDPRLKLAIHNSLSDSADALVQNPIIILAGLRERKSYDFATQYLRQCHEKSQNNTECPVYVCKKSIKKKRERVDQ